MAWYGSVWKGTAYSGGRVARVTVILKSLGLGGNVMGWNWTCDGGNTTGLDWIGSDCIGLGRYDGMI